MIALVWLLIIAVASLLVVRLGTTALVLTGLGRDTADFQAYSAFFGVGFTTRESEQVVNHPVRRRIVQHLILAGQVGLTSVIVPLVVTFVNVKTLTEGAEKLSIIVAALATLWVATSTRLFKALVDRSIKIALHRASPLRQALDHEVLLRLHAGFAVSEMVIEPGQRWVGATVGSLMNTRPGVVVLGVTGSDGVYTAAPAGATVLHAGDTLTVYGRENDVRALSSGVP